LKRRLEAAAANAIDETGSDNSGKYSEQLNNLKRRHAIDELKIDLLHRLHAIEASTHKTSADRHFELAFKTFLELAPSGTLGVEKPPMAEEERGMLEHICLEADWHADEGARLASLVERYEHTLPNDASLPSSCSASRTPSRPPTPTAVTPTASPTGRRAGETTPKSATCVVAVSRSGSNKRPRLLQLGDTPARDIAPPVSRGLQHRAMSLF